MKSSIAGCPPRRVLVVALGALLAPGAAAQDASLVRLDPADAAPTRVHGPNASETAGAALASFSMQEAAVASEKRFRMTLTPYAWLMGIEGDATIRNQDIEFEREFADLFEDVSLAGSLALATTYDRFVVSLAYDYAKIEAEDVSLIGGGGGDGEFESTFQMLEFSAGYRFDGFAEGQHVDVMLGLRSLELDNTLDPSLGGSLSSDQSLLDPMFAVRLWLPLFPSSVDGLALDFSPSIGGGGDSDLVYELNPTLSYGLGDSFEARLGYRRVSYEFDGGDNELDVSFAGMTLGFSAHF